MGDANRLSRQRAPRFARCRGGANVLLLVALSLLGLAVPVGAQDEASMLAIDQLHIFLIPMDDRLLVSEYYLVSNGGAAAYTGDAENNVTLTIPLPPGAANVQPDEDTEDVGRYLIEAGTEGGGGFISDTAPILPGEATSEIRFSYELPLSAGTTVRREVPLTTSSTVILLTGDQWRLDGERLIAFGEIDAGGGTAQAYTVDPMAAGDAFVFALQPVTTVPAAGPTTMASRAGSANEGLGIGIGVLSLVVAVVSVWALWRRDRSPRLPKALRDEIQALATLDRRFETGELEPAAYREAREVVKGRIRDRLRQDQPA